ncbi:hypothetical protein TNCV_2912011 [Trichonephila clavipes]|nr:hypothetical protein TNCV_2912011 [Trichonephila clavipes]
MWFQSHQPYFLKELRELGRRRGRLGADPLRSRIRDNWGCERGPPRGFKGLGCNLTWVFDRSSVPSSESAFILLRRHAIKVVGTAEPQGPRERNHDDLLKRKYRRLRSNSLSELTLHDNRERGCGNSRTWESITLRTLNLKTE